MRFVLHSHPIWRGKIGKKKWFPLDISFSTSISGESTLSTLLDEIAFVDEETTANSFSHRTRRRRFFFFCSFPRANNDVRLYKFSNLDLGCESRGEEAITGPSRLSTRPHYALDSRPRVSPCADNITIMDNRSYSRL